jgi:hypothetical protein
MSRVLKIIIVIVLIIIIVAIILVVRNKKPSTTPTQTPLTSTTSSTQKDLSNVNTQDYSTVLTNNYQKSTTASLAWKTNAQFVGIDVSIPEDLNPLKATETYIYDSADSPLMYFTIGYDLKSNYIRALIYKSDYMKNSNLKKISTQFWQTDWITAFQKAEKSGGKDFRTSIKDGLQINADLKYSDTNNYLYWFITYQALNASNNKVIQIDANTGQVYQPVETTNPTTTSP